MHHHTPLITTIVVALVLAFVLGALANRLRISPLVGYLLAGVLIGPFTPGYVADQGMANDLAEIGVILLMFGVGLHFTLEDLLSVRAIAIPGAIAQIASATVMGMGLAYLLGWSIGAGLVFGLALSVASTVVLLRALQERRLVETERGRIAVGWLVVEDFVMILTLVLLPALAGILKGNPGAGASALIMPVLLTLAKVAAFVAVMLVIGKRVIPWLLHAVAHSGSRELFRLSVLAIALGVAFGASMLFDVSFALGAFFAGMILSESELSQRAAQESLPLRDAFAVIFFVSVGMLVDPMIVLREPLPLLATLLIIVLGKSVAAFLIVRMYGYPTSHALTVSASLAQIGEFSFILAGLGVSLALLPERGRDLVLAGAIISILLNPVLFACVDRYLARPGASPRPADEPGAPEAPEMREPRARPCHHADWACRARRLRPRGAHHRRRPQGAGAARAPDRGDPARCAAGAGGRRRGHSRQCDQSGGDRGCQYRGGALPARRHSRCLRGRPGGGAGSDHEPHRAHRRPVALRGGDRAPQEARRQCRDHGRARDRVGDACRCSGQARNG